jgi:hypothetical protein
MKTFSDFKRKLKENVGKEIIVKNLLFENDKKNYRGNKTVRTVSKVQTNGIYTEFIDPDTKEIFNIWLDFPKASTVTVKENSVEFLTYEVELSNGKKVVSPDPSLPLGVPWLVIEFI